MFWAAFKLLWDAFEVLWAAFKVLEDLLYYIKVSFIKKRARIRAFWDAFELLWAAKQPKTPQKQLKAAQKHLKTHEWGHVSLQQSFPNAIRNFTWETIFIRQKVGIFKKNFIADFTYIWGDEQYLLMTFFEFPALNRFKINFLSYVWEKPQNH